MRLFALAMVALLSAASFAQVDAVDPDVAPTPPSSRKQPRRQPVVQTVDPDTTADEADSETADDVPSVETVSPVTSKKASTARTVDAGAGVGAGGAETTPKTVPRAVAAKKERPPAPAITVRSITDGELEQTWLRWKKSETGTDVEAEKAARLALLEMKKTIGATNVDAWAMGLLRLADTHEARGDSGAAVEIARSAVELAPSLPSAWVALARVYFHADPSDIGRYVSAIGTAVVKFAQDPRYSRPLWADLATVVLLALILTACVVVFVFFVRRAYYFFYDVHFFFPRVVSRWQTTALAVLVLALPIVFRMGLVPTLLAFFAAAALYLSTSERVVAAVLIGALGFVPLVAEVLVDHTAFAETPAQDLYLIERGGPALDALVSKWETLAAEDKVGFGELYVLGRHQLRRGHVDQALRHFRKALALNPTHVGARVNLGVAFFLQGDLENSRSVLETVAKETGHPVAWFNLGRLYQRRVAVYGDVVAGEVDKSAAAFSEASTRDPTLVVPPLDEKFGNEINGNQLMLTVPLDASEVAAFAKANDAAKRVRSQLTLMLLGDVPEVVAPLYPLVVALLLVGFGSFSLALSAAKECTRCGKAVSHRGDPDVSVGSLMCTQCVNVFAKKNVVAPSLKVRKQLEVARYQNRIERTGLILGAIWSGAGHLFAGFPVKGAAYAFFFIMGVLGVVLRNGLLRTPYEPLPMVVKIVPVVLVMVVVYIMSLRALRRGHG